MSLKNVLSKLTASIVAIYMVIGNFAVAGIGLSKVIAEETNIPKITVATQVEKYIQYSNDIGKGAVIQTKVQVGEEATQEEHKKISKTSLQIAVPKINGVNPERINIINSSTKLTNGKEDGEVNQNYDIDAGLLNIIYENKEEYNQYQEQAKDEFEIIYIYSQEAYKANEEKIEIETKVDATREYKLENSTVSNNKSQTDKFELSKNMGEIANYELIWSSDVYKGYMYSNEANKTNYETEYKNTTVFSVLNSDVTEQTKLVLGKSSFVNKENKEIGTDSIVYKSSKISEKEFDKMFGKDGWVNFYVGNTKYATINYSPEDKKGNRAYQTYYHVEGIIDNEAGKVLYPEGTLEVLVETSKPKTEGKVSIENEKTIKAKNNYGIKVKDIIKLKETTKIEEIKKYVVEEDKKDENGNSQKEQVEKTALIIEKENLGLINVKEPFTQMSLGLSTDNLSTLSENKVTATIKLNDTNSSCKLYKTGTIEIKLPNNLKSAKITNAQALYQNGLSVKNARIENGKIIISVEGNQTVYDVENIVGGVNIVLDLTLSLSNTTPTHKETIEMTFNGAKFSKEVNIVSTNSLLLLNTVNDKLYTGNAQAEIDLERNKESKEVNQTIDLVNNYDQDITNTSIIGVLAYNTENAKSNFDVKLKESVKVSGVNAKVYYSETTDKYNWKKEYTKNAKAYKVEINNNTLASKATMKLNIKLEIPEKLDYNSVNNSIMQVRYIYNKTELLQTAKIRMATEEKEIKNVTLNSERSNIELNSYATVGGIKIDNNSNLKEQEIVRYVISIKNTSDSKIDNIKVVGTVPEGTTLTSLMEDALYEEGNGFIKYNAKSVEKNISLESGKTYQFSYQVVVESINTETSKIKQESNVYINDNKVLSNVLENTVEKSEISVRIKPLVPDATKIYTDEDMPFVIELKNLTNQTVTGNLDAIIQGYTRISNIKYITFNEDGEENSISNKNIILYANEILYVRILMYIDSFEDISKEKENLEISVKFTTNKEYKSNDLNLIINQSNTNIIASLSGNLETETTIKNNSTIKYVAKIKNTGAITSRYQITDKLPEGLEAKKIEVNDSEEKLENNNFISLNRDIKAGEELTITLTCYVDTYNEFIENYFIISDDGNNFETNRIKYYVEQSEKDDIDDVASNETDKNDDATLDEEQPGDNEPGDNKPGDSEPDQGSDDENNNTEDTVEEYSISGIAWKDENRNGSRDEGEMTLSGIVATLIDRGTGNVVKDNQGNNVTVITGENGVYEFANIVPGKYIIVFDFDTSKYTVTTYQKDKVSKNINSDAIISNITVEGNSKLAGVTDNIEIIDNNLENIDIGLIENATFDLELNKTIESVTVINEQGSKTNEFKKANLAKVDLVAKYMNNTSVVTTYKFTIKNNGEVTGYVDMLQDNLPSGLEFNSELNKDWYKGPDGNLYTASLAGIAIAPGETSEVELILTKETTENTTGVFSNNAELTQVSNLEAITEKNKENNKSSADLVISIKTGSAIMYIGITLGCLAIITAGAYIIKNKIIKKNI